MDGKGPILISGKEAKEMGLVTTKENADLYLVYGVEPNRHPIFEKFDFSPIIKSDSYFPHLINIASLIPLSRKKETHSYHPDFSHS